MSKYMAGRAYADIYKVSGRSDILDCLIAAVKSSGGKILYSSPPNRAPIYMGIEVGEERIGVLIYAFRIKHVLTKNRPSDEVRGQLRYGSERSWDKNHVLGRDSAGVDTTLVLGVDPETGFLLGLDPFLYELLPMGISIYTKTEQVHQTQEKSWHVWEKENRPGTKRSVPRSPTHLETFIGFTPARLIDYIRFERRASDLELDPPLRYAAALEHEHIQASKNDAVTGGHALEDQFALTSKQILSIISDRNRLEVAVRGGVAEYHLEELLRQNESIRDVKPLDIDAMHDFDIVLTSGEKIRIECKNSSPVQFKNGDYKVEVQKTRASKNDPSSRFYRVDSFDVVAACMYSPTGEWVFRFAKTNDLARHKAFPDRLAPIQHIDEYWSHDLASAVSVTTLT